MAYGNSLTLTANATAEPSLAYGKESAKAFAKFSVAYNESTWDAETQTRTEAEPTFVDVVCFGKLAENVAESVGKGTRVTVTGKIRQERWADKESGENRSRITVVADDIAISLAFATAEITRNERDEQTQAKPARQRVAPTRAVAGRDHTEDSEPF
jgi:single-strand DNA-binding protein